MKSTLFSLNWNDFLKGAIMAVIVPILVTIQQSLAAGNVTFDWKAIGISALATFIAYLLKNFFTDDVKTAEKIAEKNDLKVVDKSAKVVPVILLLIAFSFGANAQSFFKALPKPVTGHNISTDVNMTAQNQFRPIVNVASYAIPDNSLLSGAGISYQHLQFNSETGKWAVLWSINALAWYKASLEGNANAFAYGISAGVFNNLLMIGAATDGNKAFATVGIGFNLNN